VKRPGSGDIYDQELSEGWDKGGGGFDAQRGSSPHSLRGPAPGETHGSQPETPARSGGSGPQGFCPSEHESLAIP
jgi:hypothetical protein